jgi:hypothetical protein
MPDVSGEVRAFHGFRFVSQDPAPGFKLNVNSTVIVSATFIDTSNRTLSCAWPVLNPPIIKLGGSKAMLSSGTYNSSSFFWSYRLFDFRVAWITGVVDRSTLSGLDAINATILDGINNTKYGLVSLSSLARRSTVYYPRPLHAYLPLFYLQLSVRISKKVNVSYRAYGWGTKDLG